MVARYGGEEFAVILPATTSENARVIAEQARAAVEALRIPHPQTFCGDRLTVSIGVATASGYSDTAAVLVAAADRALYHAKQLGRNRCCSSEQIIDVAPREAA